MSMRRRIRRSAHTVGEVFYGMSTFEWVRRVQKERGEIACLFFLITFGDLVGLPILPPYYTLRLLPYFVPTLTRWKQGLLRQRDWSDLAELVEGMG